MRRKWVQVYTNRKDETASSALHHTLRQHEMPQFRTEGGPEHRQDPKNAAYADYWFVFATPSFMNDGARNR